MAKMKPMSTAPAPGGDVDPFETDGITAAVGDTEESIMDSTAETSLSAEPVKLVRPAAPRRRFSDDELETLKAQVAKQNELIAELATRIASSSAAVVQADATEEREKRSREYQEKCGRPLDVRVQEIVDVKYTTGRAKFEVVLKDGNGQPKLVIPAETKADARGRYMEVCGINSCDMTKFVVNELAA